MKRIVVVLVAAALGSPVLAEETAKCEQTIAEAQQDFVNAHYADSIAKARTCVKEQPGRAWRLIGASACMLKDRATAVDAYGKLDAQGRNFLKYVCSRSNITLP